jgi:hypothetical protein
MNRIASIAAALLVASAGFALPAAATSTDREAASEDGAAGKTNKRAWPMTISMGYGSDQRCALGGCDETITEGAVTKTRARPTTLSMGYGSDQRCSLGGCADESITEGAVTKTRARPALSMGYGSDLRCALAPEPATCNG